MHQLSWIISPSEGEEDGQQWDELKLILAEVHRHDNQLQEVDQEQGGGIRDEAPVDSNLLKLHLLHVIIKQRPSRT